MERPEREEEEKRGLVRWLRPDYQIPRFGKGADKQAAAEEGAQVAASLMAMNNVWYPFVEMAEDDDLKTQRAELRMNAYATSGGVEKKQFEAFSLAASIVGKCHFCVKSHYELLKKEGLTTVQLRDIGRIAAVVSAAATVLAVEAAEPVSA